MLQRDNRAARCFTGRGQRRGLIDIGAVYKLPKLGKSKVMLYSRVSDATQLAALRTVAAAFRKIVRAA